MSPRKDSTKSSVTLLVLRPPKIISKEQKNMMCFTALKQLVLNTNLTIVCTESDKARLVYPHKKPHNNILRKFKQITSDLSFTCGYSRADRQQQGFATTSHKRQYDLFDSG